MDLDVEYGEYLQQTAKLTHKQQDYLRSLSSDIFADATQILNKDISAWEDIKISDKSRLFRGLESRKKISEDAAAKFSQLSLTDVSNKVRRDITDVSELTLTDMKRFFAPSRFSLFSIDMPLVVNEDYEYGKQESTLCEGGYMYYLRFFNLAMVDYDTQDLSTIEKLLSKLPLTYRIYETFNGYHIFITSLQIPYSSEEVPELLRSLGCDEYYIKFSQKNGYKVRLTKKKDRPETFVAKYIKKIGTAEEFPENLKLLQLHDRLLQE